jgi:hypothetical protein
VAKLATLEQYYQLMDSRPVKFTAEEVAFAKAPDSMTCCNCVHWFHNPITSSMVCEIMRPDTGDEIVAPDWTCMFWTVDYETFPKMEEPK